MTPPPMMTIRALLGIVMPLAASSQVSNCGLRKSATALSNRSWPQPWKSKSSSFVAAWMKPQSDQP